ncbi:hypothetical protein JCM10212_003934 [Sporobolomyces blumeae]
MGGKIDRSQHQTATFFYHTWPLSRFVGYRPPSFLQEDDSFRARLIYQLPTAYHRKYVAQLRERKEREDREKEAGRVRQSGETLVTPAEREHHGSGDNEKGTGKGDKGDEKKQEHEETKVKLKEKVWHMFMTFIGSFAAIAFLALSARAAIFANRGAPVVVAAFATEAVILFSEYQSPLAQPRNIMIGNVISAVIGVCIQKLFLLHGGWTVGDIFGPLPWAAAAISLSTAILVMQLLEITHPPGGATALLATTLPSVAGLGWFFIVQIIVDSLIILGWALVINNVGGRRYPTNWFWPSKKIIV